LARRLVWVVANRSTRLCGPLAGRDQFRQQYQKFDPIPLLKRGYPPQDLGMGNFLLMASLVQ